MFKVGDRVKFVHFKRGSYRLSIVAGTITKINSLAGSGTLASVTWETGVTSDYTLGSGSLVKIEDTTEQKTKDSEASEYQKHLLAIYENMVFTDFTIICKTGGEERSSGGEAEEYKFPCHKAVIATGSGHFARMFGSGMTESSSGEVVVEGYDKEEVEHFIKFLYVLKMEKEVLEKHSVKFLKMADQYDVPKLKANVTNFLRSRLTKDTVLDIVLAAHSYGSPELKSAAIGFIVKNKLEEKSLAEWKLALKGHEDLLFDIFSAVHKK